MVQGFERREGTQDSNPQKAMEKASVPLGNIMYPRPASMEGVGTELEEISKISDVFKKTLGAFAEKQNKKSLVEGEMMYIQGKTAAEVQESGDAFTLQGFQTMEAKTTGNTWYNTKLADITDKDNQKDPTQYRRDLSTELGAMLDSTQYADPALQQFVVHSTAEHMSSLVEQQMLSHNKWKKEQTLTAGPQMVYSESNKLDPTDTDGSKRHEKVKESFQASTIGLNPADTLQSIGNSLQLGAMNGNTVVRDAFMDLRGEKYTAPPSRVPNIAEAIAMADSNGASYDKDGTPNMNKLGSGAMGKYQVLKSTARDPGFGIKPVKDDSVEEADRVGLERIDKLAERYEDNAILVTMAHHAGHGAIDEHLAKGDPRKDPSVSWDTFVSTFFNPTSNLDGRLGTQTFLKRAIPFLEGSGVTKPALEHGAFISSLVKAGFKPDQVTALSNTYEKMYQEKANKFSAEKFKTETSIIDTAEADGNYSAGLKKIEEAKEALGMTDAWASSMARKLPAAIDKYQKKADTQNRVMSAAGTNTLSKLPKSEQELGINLNRAKVIGELEAAVQQGSISPNNVTQELVSRSLQFAYGNAIVDKALAADVQAGMNAPFYDKNGTVSKETLSAFQLYNTIRDIGGKEYADKYAGDSKELLDAATRYTGILGRPDTALLAARKERDDVVKNVKIPPVNPALVQSRIDEFITGIDPSFFEGVFGKSMLGTSDVFDTEVQRAKDNPRLRSFITSTYKDFHALGFKPEEIEQQVQSVISSRVDFVLGEPIITGDKGLRELAGVPGAAPDAINWAAQEYLKEAIKDTSKWKDIVEDFQVWGSTKPSDKWYTVPLKGISGAPNAISSSIRDEFRGLPEVHSQFDPMSKSLIFRPWVDKEHTNLRDEPIVIPLAALGKRIKLREAEEGTLEAVIDWAKWGLVTVPDTIENVIATNKGK